MTQLAVVGSNDFALGFRLCGVKNVITADEKNFTAKFEEGLALADVSVLIVQEDYMQNLPTHLKRRLEKLLSPVIVPISKNAGGDDLRALVKRSLGIDLWKNQ